MIRIVVADDHTILREGVKRILADAADIEVVAEARSGEDVIERVRSRPLDVLLLDLDMPGKSGIDLVREVHGEKPGVRILALGPHEEHELALRAIRAGAAGYLMKRDISSELLAAIRKVAAGGAYVSAALAEQLALGAMPDAKGPPHAALSDREFQVFHMIAQGRSISDIAAQLELSAKTVSTHKSNILQKMGLATQAELIRYALAHRLVE